MSNIDKIIVSLPINKTAALITQKYSEQRYNNRIAKKELPQNVFEKILDETKSTVEASNA